MKILLLGLIFFILSCTNTKPKTDKQILDFGLFSIETPLGWKRIHQQGIDSYVGEIAIDDTDTLGFDLGGFSNKLNEYIPPILDSSMMQSVDSSVLTYAIFVKDRRVVDEDEYRKNNIFWDTVDGRKAKLVIPIQPGIGKTGIYIDSLWETRSSIDKFCLYGENLKANNQKLVLEAIHTLKFKNGK